MSLYNVGQLSVLTVSHCTYMYRSGDTLILDIRCTFCIHDCVLTNIIMCKKHGNCIRTVLVIVIPSDNITINKLPHLLLISLVQTRTMPFTLTR